METDIAVVGPVFIVNRISAFGKSVGASFSYNSALLFRSSSVSNYNIFIRATLIPFSLIKLIISNNN